MVVFVVSMVLVVSVVVMVVLVPFLVEEFGEDSSRQEELDAVVVAVMVFRHDSRKEDVRGQDADGHQEDEEVHGVHLRNGSWKRETNWGFNWRGEAWYRTRAMLSQDYKSSQSDR